MWVTDIFFVRGDSTLIRLSSYNTAVIASVSLGCQSQVKTQGVAQALFILVVHPVGAIDLLPITHRLQAEFALECP